MLVQLDIEHAEFLDTIWTTADGKQIRIGDMEDSHVINIIYHMKKYDGFYPNTQMFSFINEARRRNLTWWEGPIPFQYPPEAPEFVRNFEWPNPEKQ